MFVKNKVQLTFHCIFYIFCNCPKPRELRFVLSVKIKEFSRNCPCSISVFSELLFITCNEKPVVKFQCHRTKKKSKNCSQTCHFISSLFVQIYWHYHTSIKCNENNCCQETRHILQPRTYHFKGFCFFECGFEHLNH